MDGLVDEASHLCTAMVESAVIAAQRDIRSAGTAGTTAATAAADAILSLLALATSEAASQTAGTASGAADSSSCDEQQVSARATLQLHMHIIHHYSLIFTCSSK
jgi:phage/plasmid primase-like uncharacterized protein